MDDNKDVNDKSIKTTTMDAALHPQLFSLTLMFSFTVLSGFTAFCVMRRVNHLNPRTGLCFSSGVFLAWSMLDLLPQYLMNTREAFTQLNITLRFPLPEFLLSVGLLTVCVLEQMLLTFREQAPDVSPETNTLLDIPKPPYRRIVEDPMLVCLLVVCVCVCALLEGLSMGFTGVGALQECVSLAARQGVLSFSVCLHLSMLQLKRRCVFMCVLVLSALCPLGMALGKLLSVFGMIRSMCVSVGVCCVQGLICGIFMSVCITTLTTHQFRSAKNGLLEVCAILSGFTLYTALVFTKVQT
ncbi:hypothetical protein DNTS_023466 [Danionella cerebrum]|uniref:Uncharacterized protein n=1 Tax=Danionella cerebrum TaxID=2873325 RepID=A0A553R9I8_9TELE|nr:hypothetical protein DNTS_023466 [Danionella translucida]